MENVSKLHKGMNLGSQASDPAGGVEGDFYTNSTTNKVRAYVAGAWRNAVFDDLTQTFTNKSFSDSTTEIVDASDPTKKIKLDAAGTAGTSTTLLSSQTTNKILTLPDATDTLVGKATTDTLTNKTLVDSSTIISDAGDPTKQIKFDAAGTTSTSTTLLSSQTTDKTLTLPDATDTLVGKATTDSLTNKTLVDSSTAIADVSDPTKQLKFDVAGTTGKTTTISAVQTDDRTLTLPDATDTLVGRATADTLSNKQFSDFIETAEVAAPATPATGLFRVYAKTDGKIYGKNDGGTEYDLTATGSGGFDTVRMVITGPITALYTRIDGFHASQDTKNLTKISITAGNSGTGTTTVRINRNSVGPSGSGSVTASLTGDGATKTTTTTLGSPLSLSANDLIDADLTAISANLEDLTIELIFA